MTEQEWLTCESPEKMLLWLNGYDKAPLMLSERKSVKFACACYWNVSEEFGREAEEYEKRCIRPAADPFGWAYRCSINEEAGSRIVVDKRLLSQRAAILREVIGNPFLQWSFPLGLVTKQVMTLARAAYDDRISRGLLDPFRLGLVADALEDEGCEFKELMDHLRLPNNYGHYRGCWALDIVLGEAHI